jgi:hypothetical protein
MDEARESFGGRLLVRARARQRRLVAGLLVNDRGDEYGDGFDLMAVRPGQKFFDILP